MCLGIPTPQEGTQASGTCLGTPLSAGDPGTRLCLGTLLLPGDLGAWAPPRNPTVPWGSRHLGAMLWGHGVVVGTPVAGAGPLAPWKPRHPGRGTWLVALGGPGVLAPWGAPLPALLWVPHSAVTALP